MIDRPYPPTFERPFPALTSEQRYHFEVYGYTVIENTLKPGEISECKDAVYRIRASRTLDRTMAEQWS